MLMPAYWTAGNCAVAPHRAEAGGPGHPPRGGRRSSGERVGGFACHSETPDSLSSALLAICGCSQTASLLCNSVVRKSMIVPESVFEALSVHDMSSSIDLVRQG